MEGGGSDLETSVSLDDSREDMGGIAGKIEAGQGSCDVARDGARAETCDVARLESREGSESPLGSMWDRYLRRTFERKSKNKTGSRSNTLESERSSLGG